MAKNAKCAKWRRKKRRNYFETLHAHSYLGIGWRDLLQIWNVDSPSSGASLQHVWSNSGKWSQSYVGVKITFFGVPVNVLTGWRDGFLGRTTHYCVSWSVKFLPIIIIEMFLRENNSVSVLHFIRTSNFLALLWYHAFVSLTNLYILGIAFFTIKLLRRGKTIMVNKSFIMTKTYFLASFLMGCSLVFSRLHYDCIFLDLQPSCFFGGDIYHFFFFSKHCNSIANIGSRRKIQPSWSRTECGPN